MKKLLNTYNPILITTILLSAASMQSMEINYEQKVKDAEAYNEKNQKCINFIEGLLTLPNDMLNQIFCFDSLIIPREYGFRWYDSTTPVYNPSPDEIKPLENRMKFFMKLRTVSKQFYRTLTHEAIGNRCQNYEQRIKNSALQHLARYNFLSSKKRLPALILICAGAQNRITWLDIDTPIHYDQKLFCHAVLQNDAPFVATLFKYNIVTPNAWSLDGPLLFEVKTKEIAQLFIDHGVNVNSQFGEFNVLWKNLNEQYPSELMKLYLAHNADATLCNQDGSCLLHQISSDIVWTQQDVKNTLKKAQLLLKAIPTMINTVNRSGQTPLDIAQKHLRNIKLFPVATESLKKLIVLFRKHGALTAKKLAEQAMPTNQIK